MIEIVAKNDESTKSMATASVEPCSSAQPLFSLLQLPIASVLVQS